MELNKNLISNILTQINLKVESILPSSSGYRNTSIPVITDKGTYNIVIFKREKDNKEGLYRANLVSNYLYSKGFPTRKLVKTLKSSESPSRYICIYNYLEGKTIPWEMYDMNLLKELGRTMSDMHFLSNDFNQTNILPSIKTESLELLKRMQKYFSTPGVIEAMKNKLKLKLEREYLNSLEDKIKNVSETSSGVLHMDFVRGNILFDSDIKPEKIVGIIDWEKVSFGPYVFDIARTLAFLYVDCKYKDDIKVKKYFLTSGYLKRGKNKNVNLNDLDVLVDFYLFYDICKFLLHNPYESLYQNEHFNETIRLAIFHGLVSVVQ